MGSATRTRMFPLSNVLFPRGVMPLHIFEPRYLAMINDSMNDDHLFGVVLIERGPEVGGGDTRFGVGTRARIVRAGVLGDGERMVIVAVGTERFRVERWLDDDPYPVAMVADHPQQAPNVDLTQPVEDAMRSWRRVAALASELGTDVGLADLSLPSDPLDALWTLCSVSPLEQIDRQRLLELDEPAVRAEQLRRDLNDRAELLEARLAGGLN